MTGFFEGKAVVGRGVGDADPYTGIGGAAVRIGEGQRSFPARRPLDHAHWRL